MIVIWLRGVLVKCCRFFFCFDQFGIKLRYAIAAADTSTYRCRCWSRRTVVLRILAVIMKADEIRVLIDVCFPARYMRGVRCRLQSDEICV